MVLNFLKSSYNKVKQALGKTILGQKIRALFGGNIDEETLENLERILYEADLGVQLSLELTNKVRIRLKENNKLSGEQLLLELQSELLKMITFDSFPSQLDHPPQVILIVGVNGNGKTTSVAKLARRYKESGKKVLVAAADTFRAAATEQLEMWAQHLEVDIVKGSAKSDPAAVVFDAMSAAHARKMDVVLVDTAGRLHTKTPLMQELEKIKRSCRKFSSHSPHETLLVVDASVGQNAIEQAQIFNKYTPITGLILTKLDGSAKGGIAINIQRQLKIPVKFIGVGEGIEDLEPFNPETFIQALFS